MSVSSEKKPLAAILVADKGEGESGPADDESGEGEQETAKELATMLGAKDPEAAGSMLVDVIRQCIAAGKAGKY